MTRMHVNIAYQFFLFVLLLHFHVNMKNSVFIHVSGVYIKYDIDVKCM